MTEDRIKIRLKKQDTKEKIVFGNYFYVFEDNIKIYIKE
jgi:hypothetical protein